MRQAAKAILALAAAGTCCGLATSVSAVPRPAAAAVHRMIIDRMTFGVPGDRFRVGDTILWVNNDLFRHTATAADHSFDVDLPPHAQARTVLKHAGVIAFSCRYHSAMKGSITVAPR